MAFVSECSHECAIEQCDLFTVAPTQTSIESSTDVEYRPISSLNDSPNIDFEINGSGGEYLDLSRSYLHVKAKVTQTNGADLPNDDDVAPVNNFLHSMFSQVDISLNGTQISASTNTYAYRAIIETLLSFSTDAKNSQLGMSLYYKDQAGRMDEIAVDGTANSGFMSRRAKAARSRIIDMIGRIHGDIFFQDRLMLNDVNIKITLTRSSDAFCLIGGTQRKVKIVSCQLFVRKVKLTDSVSLAHAKALEVATAKYPIKRVVCKNATVSAGLQDIVLERLFTGQLPTRLVIGLVDNEAFNGARDRNPFNFEHFNVSEITVYLSGQGQPVKTIKPDFANGRIAEAYMSLFTGTNKINRDEGIDITSDDYGNGYALYAFDLTLDLCEGGNFNLIKQGSVRVSLKFSTALARAINVVAYAEFENILEIDRARNVIFDFAKFS
jgi:hypothetical protein